jgi:hypothetical protein
MQLYIAAKFAANATDTLIEMRRTESNIMPHTNLLTVIVSLKK